MVYIETLLTQWEAYGVFDYMLPFLLIFAMVFGILSTTNILGGQKQVHIIISLIIGLLSLRVGYVQAFFTEVFPRTGVALAVILVLVILTSIFVPDDHSKGWAIGLYCVGGFAALMVVFNTFSELNFFGSDWWYQWGGMIIGVLLLVGVIIAISVGSGGGGGKGSGKASFSPRWPASG